MARWRLKAPAYLMVPGTEFVQVESSHAGRPLRKVYKVPRHLDPENQDDQTETGILVVCHEGKGKATDIVFHGSPIPEMEPLDEEAESISAPLMASWNKIAGLGDSYDSRLVEGFIDQIVSLAATSRPSTPSGELERMQAQIDRFISENSRSESAIPPTNSPADAARRV